MGGRDKYKYKVHLLNVSTGEAVEHEIDNYWSPKDEGTLTALGLAAKAELFIKNNKQFQFDPISAELVSATL